MRNTVLQCGWVFVFVVAAAGARIAQAGEDAKPPAESAAGQHLRAKQIIGSKVTLEGNMEVGTVDDIVLDDNGNVDYLVVANSDNKLVTVPWDAARFHADKRVAVVHITPERFQQVPTYTAERYPAFYTPAYRTQVYKYYGLTPAQERRIIRRGGVVVP